MNAPLDAGLARDYVLLVFLGALGVLQVAASYSKLRGLMLFPRALACYAFGLSFFAGAFLWFFASGDRNVRGSVGGVAAGQQFYLFLLGAALAVAATVALSSLLRRTAFQSRRRSRLRGLIALKNSTYVQVLATILRQRGVTHGRSRRPRFSLDKWARR